MSKEKAMAEDVRICDVCLEVIEPGQLYYEMPDGMTVCCDSDCLVDWAHEYRRQAPGE